MPQIRVSNLVLDLARNEKTYFDADEASGQTGLSANGTNFAANDHVVLGKFGYEKSEIRKISNASASAITVSAATTFQHNRGDLITFIPYNQIVVERSTDGGVTFTPLTAVDIQADNPETIIQRPSDAATDMYRVRFYNSVSGLYSDYSDTVLASGYADNSVFSIKKRALDDLGESVDDIITDTLLNTWLWEGRRELDKQQTKWKWRTYFNADLGDVIPGRWSLALPSTYRDPYNNHNMLSLRIGSDNLPLEYQDRNRFNQNYRNIQHTRLLSAITTSSTEIQLNSTGDLEDSGTIYIAAESVTGVVDAVTYTGNNKSTNTLTGVSGITENHAAGRDVWQGTNFGVPRAYTIDNGVIYFDVPFEDELAAENIKADYYGTMPAYNSDADLLDEPDYDIFVPYLRYKIKYKKSNGSLDTQKDPDYILFRAGIQKAIDNNLIGQEIYLIPEDDE